jgi:hypothetical protein
MDPEEIADLLEAHWTPSDEPHPCLCQYLKVHPEVAAVMERRILERKTFGKMGHA